MVVEFGAAVAVEVAVTSVLSILSTDTVVVDNGNVIDGANCDTVENIGVEGREEAADKSDCNEEDENANLNFFRCLFVCFKCSRFAWARRRKTKESGILSLGSDISFVLLMLSSKEWMASE